MHIARKISALLAVLLLCCAVPAVSLADATGLAVESVEFELGAIINITIKENGRKMAGYYFGAIPDQPTSDNYDWYEHFAPILRVTKFPGTYYLWLPHTH